MFDLVIQNGQVVDGTGGPPVFADIGIRDGLIVAVGENLGPANAWIDANGCVVTPGFIDLHTHYDGQASWDGELAPSTWHGVTTAVMGSCGVGFAPVRPDHHDRIVDLLEGVEDMPGTALHEGIPWTWETLPQYLDALDGIPHAADLLVQVPHDAVRMYVMGDRAVAGEAATADDLEQMVTIVREAMEAGCVGFSTGRSDNHRDAHGAYTPASEADAAELRALAGALKGLNHGVLQAVSDFDMNAGPEHFEAEFQLLIEMMKASDKPLSTTLLQRDLAPGQWTKILEGAETAVNQGLDLRVQVAPRAIGVMLGLEATFHPFIGRASYREIAHLPLAQRVAELRKPERKAAILAEPHESVAGDDSSMPRFVDDFLEKIVFLTLRMFRLGEPPQYEPDMASSLYMEAERQGRDVLELFYDCLLEDEGHALLYFPLFNYSGMNLDDVHRMLTHPQALVGLSDGGAHVGTICDGSFPTTLLTHWVRDREGDRLTVPQAIQMLTAAPADWLGLTDRGRVEVGLRADLNVIDLDQLTLHHPRVHHDLPAGGSRLLQQSTGYRATLLGGVVVRRDDTMTGQRPGRVVRMGQSSTT